MILEVQLKWTVEPHWGRVTHWSVSKLTIIGSDDGLSPGRHQAIIWNNAGILLTGPLGTNLSEILIVINAFSFKKMRFNMSSGKWRQFCLGLNVLTLWPQRDVVIISNIQSPKNTCYRLCSRARILWCCSPVNTTEHLCCRQPTSLGNVGSDLYCHMPSLGNNGLTPSRWASQMSDQ